MTMDITLGGVELKTGVDVPSRFSMLLWGLAKSGKTTLAATAPGKKLWINFDPDGLASLYGREDIIIADFSAEKFYAVMPRCLKEEDPLGLVAALKQMPDVGTIVVDSMTTFSHMAQQHAVKEKNLRDDEPGQRGYTVRNNYIKRFTRSMLRVAQQADKSIILICHEAPPQMDDDGHIVQITMALSGSLNSELSLLPSELWHVSDVSGQRRIAVRNCRQRQPMGTRMFDTAGEPEFMWKYDPVAHKGAGIADWFKQWQEKGGKIPLPR